MYNKLIDTPRCSPTASEHYYRASASASTAYPRASSLSDALESCTPESNSFERLSAQLLAGQTVTPILSEFFMKKLTRMDNIFIFYTFFPL